MSIVIRSTKNSTYKIKLCMVLRKGLTRYAVSKLYDGLFDDGWDSKEAIFKLCGANDFGGRVVHKIGSVMVVDVYQDTILGGV
jgi:hypothetical protein